MITRVVVALALCAAALTAAYVQGKGDGRRIERAAQAAATQALQADLAEVAARAARAGVAFQAAQRAANQALGEFENEARADLDAGSRRPTADDLRALDRLWARSRPAP